MGWAPAWAGRLAVALGRDGDDISVGAAVRAGGAGSAMGVTLGEGIGAAHAATTSSDAANARRRMPSRPSVPTPTRAGVHLRIASPVAQGPIRGLSMHVPPNQGGGSMRVRSVGVVVMVVAVVLAACGPGQAGGAASPGA